MATASHATEEKELNLVDKVELRIALADSETKLQSLLSTYLCPLLLKLESPHKKVRDKVISVCQHINARIKPNSIQLPVASLLKQFKDHTNQLVRHFDLLYLQQGLGRLSVPDRLDLLPTLVCGIAANFSESSGQTSNLFNVLLRVLHQLKLPPRGSKEDLELRVKLRFDEDSQDPAFVAEWLGKVILFSPVTSAGNCPGLSVEECEFIQIAKKPDTWDPTLGGLRLAETKVVAAKFLVCGAFTESERFFPAFFASSDSNSRLSDVGDDMLKRALPTISLEDKAIIKRLFFLYFGSGDPSGPLPVKPPLRGKILGLLCRSKEATAFAVEISRIVKEGIEVTTDSADTRSLSSKKGLEASKLRSQVFAFLNWVARIGSESTLKAVAPELVNELRKYIVDQGWPRAQDDVLAKNSPELVSRSYAYESIGLLARAGPKSMLLEPRLDLLNWLLRSLSSDNSGKDTAISIETALSTVLGTFASNQSIHLFAVLESLLLQYVTVEQGSTSSYGALILRSTRFVAVRFANRCLPFSNCTGRWIDLVALADADEERNEVLEEGKKGLDPYWYRNLNPSNIDNRSAEQIKEYETSHYGMPDVDEFVEFCFHDQSKAFQSMHHAYSTAVRFCCNVLINTALAEDSMAPMINSDWQNNLDVLVMNDEEARAIITKHLRRYNTQASSPLTALMDAAFLGLVNDSLKDNTLSGSCLLELCSLSPGKILDSQLHRINSLKTAIISSKHLSRITASHVFGILATRVTASNTEIENFVEFLYTTAKTWESAIGLGVHQVHGSILALSFMLSRTNVTGNGVYLISDGKKLKTMNLVLNALIGSHDKDLQEAAITSLDEFCLFKTYTPDMLDLDKDVDGIVKRLEEIAKTGNEKAVSCLGHLAMQCPEDQSEESLLDRIVRILYSLHEQRQAELQFAVGSALSCAAVGWDSKSLIGVYDIGGSPVADATRNILLQSILEQVLKNCKQTKPALRQASVIWLLCLVQYCGHLSAVQDRLRVIQQAFKSFLSDRDSLNQETASRGLTLVYEKGDREVKDDLVRDLVGSFTSSQSNLAGSVAPETELFEPGALPTGEGSVTTYKDIVNLASEVGDPSLVYRFMSLASNSSIWSSRAAFGRFGLSRILSDSSVDGFLAHNPKLYPALFRYRFDPNTNVRAAMNDIWNALIKDPAAVIETHFDRIMDDLLKNILGKEWRTREASCAAIADLVQGKPLAMYEKYLTQIWTVTFKVCDDIKDTVRKAAMALARVLTGILIRSFEGGEASASTTNAMLKQVLPFLLSPSGLESSADEVRSFALITLLEIIKKGSKKTLRPFVAELVGSRLLPLLSSMEPEAINYIHLNADKYGMTEQQIDDARLSSVKMSPMMEAIERCLDMLDELSMKDLADHLGNATKTVIGLPSKVGVSRVLVSLSTRHNLLFKPYADSFLKLLRKQVLDRNDTVSTSAAAACGYIGRIASDEELLKHIDYAKGLYFGSEDERNRTIAGELVLGLAKYATDRFQSLASSLLPFVFLAKHDTNDATKEVFKATWDETVGGSRAIQLYLQEIVALAVEHIASSRWALKHASSYTVADTIQSLGKDISASNAKILWPVLEKSIGGKTWEGKEKVLDAFLLYVKNSAFSREQPDITEQMQKIILREAKRNNTGLYRQHAMACLGDLTEVFPATDWYDQIQPIVEPVIDSILKEKDKMDIDSKVSGTPSSKLISEETLANAIRTLLRSVNPAIRMAPSLEQSLVYCAHIVKDAASQQGLVVQNAIFEGEKLLFEKIRETEALKISSETILKFLATLDDHDDLAETARIKAAEALERMADASKQKAETRDVFLKMLNQWIRNERSNSVLQVLQRIEIEVGKLA